MWGDLHRDRFIGERALRMDPVASAEAEYAVLPPPTSGDAP